eukprot:CAMPEP_0194357294 /NCGR_PEP_ID=MMETSP0174-20130528/4795_1 /TAXON_ID=216777 /ORGANISM="Proboscia alata, Strain PI-D3" /LENGTH=280 /DNA_ID=CAMNT_0039127247 /DNA_START=66 /DNA_END=908 /DNA_ORIENTATION=-
MEGTGRIVVIIGAGSKHDKDAISSNEDFDPATEYGLGGALGMPFAEAGYHVVLVGRRENVLQSVQKNTQDVAKGGAKVTYVQCDVTKEEDVERAYREIQDNATTNNAFVDCIIYNAAPAMPPNFSFGTDSIQPHMIDTENMSTQFDILVNGVIRFCKHFIPDMVNRNSGCVLLSGATMQLRGGANFGAMAPAKTAQRSLGQSMFQCYGSKGVHVCNIVIDGVIDSPNTRKWFGGKPSEKLMPPIDLAGQYLSVYRQPKSVWSYELTLTPGVSSASVGMRM